MATRPVSSHGHAGEHQRQADLKAQAAPAQQCGVGQLVEQETGGRDGEKAPRSGTRRHVVTAEAEAVMASERNRQGHQPRHDVGPQWWHGPSANQQHDDAQVRGRSGTADQHEPVHVSTTTTAAASIVAQAGHRSARSIALCVDDFGLHDGVNHAAIALVQAGRVTAVSCLSGAPAWQRGALELRHLDVETVDIGLHLDLSEYPLRSAPWRTPFSALLGLSKVMSNPLALRALRAEIDAQFDAFVQALGRLPDFVDGHRHVHQLPLVREQLLQALSAQCAGMPLARPWLRNTRRPAATGAVPRLKPWLIEALGAAALSRLAAQHGFAQNAHLLGVHGFDGDALRYQTLLARWWAMSQHGDLLMCHPSAATTAHDPLLPARLQEFKALSETRFAHDLAQAGLTLRPMRQILMGAPLRCLHPAAPSRQCLP